LPSSERGLVPVGGQKLGQNGTDNKSRVAQALKLLRNGALTLGKYVGNACDKKISLQHDAKKEHEGPIWEKREKNGGRTEKTKGGSLKSSEIGLGGQGGSGDQKKISQEGGGKRVHGKVRQNLGRKRKNQTRAGVGSEDNGPGL